MALISIEICLQGGYYQLRGPGGELSEPVDFGLPATIEVGAKKYLAYLGPDGAEYAVNGPPDGAPVGAQEGTDLRYDRVYAIGAGEEAGIVELEYEGEEDEEDEEDEEYEEDEEDEEEYEDEVDGEEVEEEEEEE